MTGFCPVPAPAGSGLLLCRRFLTHRPKSNHVQVRKRASRALFQQSENPGLPTARTQRPVKRPGGWPAPTDGPAHLPAGKVPLTARGRRTADAIAEAARQVIARDGFEAARISDIAKAAGTSLGSFYTYFETKEQVLERLIEDFRTDVVERSSKIARDNRPPYDIMRDFVRVYWETYRSHRNVLQGLIQVSMTSPRLAACWRRVRSGARQQFALSIGFMQAQGYCPGLDPEAAASALGSMIDYFAFVWLIEGGEEGRPSIGDELAVETLTSIWFHSVFWKPDEMPAAHRPPSRRKKHP